MKFLDRLALNIERNKQTEIETLSRRVWMKNLAVVSATGAVVWACGKDDAKSDDAPAAKINYKADADLLNAALALEHEAISIYTQAATLPAMKAADAAAVLAIATAFAGHHVEHRDTLIATIKDLKTKDATVADPVAAKTDAEYVSAATATALSNDLKGILRVAAIKEGGAAEAYLGLISSFTDTKLAQVSGMLGGDEAGHFGVLRAALLVVIKDTTVTTANVIPTSLPSSWKSKSLPAPGA